MRIRLDIVFVDGTSEHLLSSHPPFTQDECLVFSYLFAYGPTWIRLDSIASFTVGDWTH